MKESTKSNLIAFFTLAVLLFGLVFVAYDSLKNSNLEYEKFQKENKEKLAACKNPVFLETIPFVQNGITSSYKYRYRCDGGYTILVNIPPEKP
jgi:hypothetical protein